MLRTLGGLDQGCGFRVGETCWEGRGKEGSRKTLRSPGLGT